MKTLEIIIDENGEVQIEAHGYVGVECEKATAELERMLGKVTERKAKPERAQHAVTRKESVKR